MMKPENKNGQLGPAKNLALAHQGHTAGLKPMHGRGGQQ